TAVALAEHLSGSVEEFSILMNERAREIGVKNSYFVTPHGLDNEEHYTTAYDLAILTNVALKNETFARIVETKQISVMIGNHQRSLNNTNELLGNVSGVYGVKTGFTGEAGRCLVTACKRNDLDVIIVVLGADTKSIRGSDTKKMINYVFENFKMVDTKKEMEELFSYFKNNQKIQTLKSLSNVEIEYTPRENYICPIDKNKVGKLRTSIYCLSQLEAPVEGKTIIGKMRLICDTQILYEIDIYLGKKIDRIDWREYLRIFVKNYITFYAI
ncbi:MAG: D-alanyl-D-alanine carboxypeptidase, partial [Clostridia bacterium]|nr:D-alanyl-D-alanine carboxypeptidase [Clostridia bacterium]